MPKVSWVIPVFNAASYLGPALASVAAQSFRDFEVIVVDDGSVDGSAAIIRQVCAEDTRFRYVHQANAGVVDALNHGLDQCTGQYLARMDADDLCEPERLECQVAYLDSHPACVVAGSRVIIIDDKGTEVRRSSRSAVWRAPGPSGFPPGGITLAHPSVTGRTAAFRAAGGYRHGFSAGEDYDMWFRMRRQGEVVELPDYLLRYRVHERSESAIKLRQQRLSCIKAEIVDYLAAHPVPPDDLDTLIACTTPEELFSRAERIGAGLPRASILMAYFLAECLRRATYRLPAPEARRLAAETSRAGLGLVTGLSSSFDRFFLVFASREVLRWGVVSLIGRNRSRTRT